MIDEKKIRLMTKLALYDKTHGKSDKTVNELYYRDYVYRRNFRVRVFALFGTIVPIAFFTIYTVLDEDMDFFNFDYAQFGINIAIFVSIVLLVYTIIGTSVATAEYAAIRKRLKSYFAIIKELEELKDIDKPLLDDYEDFDQYYEETKYDYE